MRGATTLIQTDLEPNQIRGLLQSVQQEVARKGFSRKVSAALTPHQPLEDWDMSGSYRDPAEFGVALNFAKLSGAHLGRSTEVVAGVWDRGAHREIKIVGPPGKVREVTNVIVGRGDGTQVG